METTQKKPRWWFCEGRVPLPEPCPECGGRLFEHPNSHCEDDECPESGKPNLGCEFLECRFTYMCRSVLSRCRCPHPLTEERCPSCKAQLVKDGPASGCVRCEPGLLELLTHQGGCGWMRRYGVAGAPPPPLRHELHLDAECVLPARRGARRQARRLAKASPGVYVVVRSRSGWAQYQVVWYPRGFLTYVFDRSAGPGRPRRCRMTPDQFDRSQPSVRMTPWRSQ